MDTGDAYFYFTPVTTVASSSDTVEQWRRPRGIRAAALADVVNQRPFRPHFWHTLHLVSSSPLFFLPPPASDPSRQTTLDKQQETKGLISPLNLVETQCRLDCENKCDLAEVGAGWKGGLVAARSCSSPDSGVQQALGLCYSCDLIKGDGWAPSELLSGGARRLFRGVR